MCIRDSVRPVHFVNLAELPPAGTGGGAAVQFNTTIYKRAFSQNRFIAVSYTHLDVYKRQGGVLSDPGSLLFQEEVGVFLAILLRVGLTLLLRILAAWQRGSLKRCV